MKQGNDRITVCALSGEFKGLTLKRCGNIATLVVSSLVGVDALAITDDKGNVIKLVPLKQQAEPKNDNIIKSTPTLDSFHPANAMVPVGEIMINAVSTYLSDLPDTAIAELLVAPRDTAYFFDGRAGSFFKDIDRIRRIDEKHGIHYAGQVLKGMSLYDYPEWDRTFSYEKMLADKFRDAFVQASRVGKPVLTGLAIGTKQIVHGCANNTRIVTLDNNIRSRVGDINTALNAQDSHPIVTESGLTAASLQMTCTENSFGTADVYAVQFDEDYARPIHKGMHEALSRPIALLVYPS